MGEQYREHPRKETPNYQNDQIDKEYLEEKLEQQKENVEKRHLTLQHGYFGSLVFG